MNYLLAFLICLVPFQVKPSNPEFAQEHSLLIADRVLDCPPKQAGLDEWSVYVARKWRGWDVNGNYSYVYEDRFCPDGSPIDLLTVKERSTPNCFFQKEMVWEVRRAYDWQRAIGRVLKIKGLSRKDYAGIILVIDNIEDDALNIKNASIACREAGVYLRTVTPDGKIR